MAETLTYAEKEERHLEKQREMADCVGKENGDRGRVNGNEGEDTRKRKRRQRTGTRGGQGTR